MQRIMEDVRYSCPCNCRNCLLNNDLTSEKHFMKFNDYIDNQVNLVRELLQNDCILLVHNCFYI